MVVQTEQVNSQSNCRNEQIGQIVTPERAGEQVLDYGAVFGHYVHETLLFEEKLRAVGTCAPKRPRRALSLCWTAGSTHA